MAAEAQARAGTSLRWWLSAACSNQAPASPASRNSEDLAQIGKALIENKIQELGVGSEFRVLFDRIETPGGGLIIFLGMQDQNAESIKSLEGYDIAWVEEAQTLSARSLALLRPTIRADGSELWFTWNPRRKSDAVDEFLRAATLQNAIVVKANFPENPFFPAALEEEMQLDRERYPDRFEHIWLGEYAKAFEHADLMPGKLTTQIAQGFIGRVERRPDRSGRHRIDANAAIDEISQVLRMRVSSRSRRVFKFGMRLLGLLTMD